MTSSTSASPSPSAASPLSLPFFLFEFDGVVCDSCDECTVSAWRTCLKLQVIHQPSAKQASSTAASTNDPVLPYPPQWLFPVMRQIRPAIETGWQIPVLLSIVYDDYHQSKSNDNKTSEQNDEHDQNASSQNQQQQQQQDQLLNDILANYQNHVSSWLERHQLTDKDMIATFGFVRDEWMQPPHLTSWLDINIFYNSVPAAINQCRGTAALVTTKQHRFAQALCRHAGITNEALPAERIYGLGQYKNKAQVIREYMEKAKEIMTIENSSSSDENKTGTTDVVIYFFEDRWPTLVKCLTDPKLNDQHDNDNSTGCNVKVQFYLCAWGYCTEHELAQARAEPRVTVLELNQFQELVAGKQS